MAVSIVEGNVKDEDVTVKKTMNGERHSTAENGGAPSVRTSYGNTAVP
jgi:hypothetical protein